MKYLSYFLYTIAVSSIMGMQPEREFRRTKPWEWSAIRLVAWHFEEWRIKNFDSMVKWKSTDQIMELVSAY